ncbi:MAG: SdrD B-like domain-containing protein [Actinomycetes bacterium]
MGAELAGVVWIDFNHNGVQDDGEPPLPGILVEATQISPTAFRASLIADLVTGSYGRAVTESDGSYVIRGLRRTAYKVVGQLEVPGLKRTWDTGGTATWSVTASLVSGFSEVDMAAAGSANLGGTVQRQDTLEVVPNAPVACTWAGVDGVVGTWDDVDVSTTTAADGTFSLEGMPYGEYQCTSSDPSDGASTSMTAMVTAQQSTVQMLVGKGSAGFRPVAQPVALRTAAPAEALALTGSNSTILLLVGFALIVTGADLRRRSRPRRTETGATSA